MPEVTNLCFFNRFVLCALPSDRRELHKLIYERSFSGKGMLTVKRLIVLTTRKQTVLFRCGKLIKKSSVGVI